MSTGPALRRLPLEISPRSDDNLCTQQRAVNPLKSRTEPLSPFKERDLHMGAGNPGTDDWYYRKQGGDRYFEFGPFTWEKIFVMYMKGL